MNTKDLGLHESGSGGDLAILNNDLVLSESLFNTIYLSLFGGNVEASTLGNEVHGEERMDWWANELLFKNTKQKQFNSETERTLNNTVLNSSGRVKIQTAVENDLIFLKKIVDLSVNVVILSTNRAEIQLQLTSKSNKTSKELQLIWDNAKKELITNKII